MAYQPRSGKTDREADRANLGASLSPDRIGEYAFRAGRMQRVPGTNRVTAERTKGLVYLAYGEDDELLHWYWKNRETGEVEDDLIVFPDDAEFRFVSQATNDRVFALYFKSSGQTNFYWMQSKDDAMDGRHYDAVNQLLQSPEHFLSDLKQVKQADPNAHLKYAGPENEQARVGGKPTSRLRRESPRGCLRGQD